MLIWSRARAALCSYRGNLALGCFELVLHGDVLGIVRFGGCLGVVYTLTQGFDTAAQPLHLGVLGRVTLQRSRQLLLQVREILAPISIRIE